MTRLFSVRRRYPRAAADNLTSIDKSPRQKRLLGSVDQRAHSELSVNLAVLSRELSGVEVAQAEAGGNERREATTGQKSPAVPGSKSVFHDFLPNGR